jgi:hypothetical protein
MLRKDFIGFKVSENENETIRGKAERTKSNISAYVRSAAMNKEIIVIDGFRELIPELNAIGNNLNQTTVLLRKGNIQNPNFEVIKERFCRLVEKAEAMQHRITDLDKILKKLYEDNTLGRITDMRFAILSKDYENEQQELMVMLNALKEKAQTVKETADKAQQFLGFIRKYTGIEELDAKILNELIEKIVVSQKTLDEDGKKVQKIDIYYKFVGLLQAG